MAFRSRKFKYVDRGSVNCKCGHPQMTHYTKNGDCVYDPCDCTSFRTAGRTPFQNKRAVCQYGHSHNSGLEIKTCFDLHLRRLAGDIRTFDAEKNVNLLGPSGAVVATYKVDFIVEHLDGVTEYIETKGAHLLRMQPWPLKWALLQDKHKGDSNFRFTVITG